MLSYQNSILIYKNSILIDENSVLQNIERDIRGARDTDIEFMNCTREEITSIARSMIEETKKLILIVVNLIVNFVT